MRKILLLIAMLWGFAYGQCGDAAFVTATPVSISSERISWNNAGGTVAYYIWTLSPGGTSGQTAGSPLTLTGLTPATAYTFTVQAKCTDSSTGAVVSKGFTTVAALIYTPMTAGGYQFKYGKFDSGLALPLIDTTLGRGTTRAGVLVYKPGNGALVWNGSAWVSLSKTVALVVDPLEATQISADTSQFAERQSWVDSIRALFAGGSGWGLTGNAGTDSAVNFIGTTDAVPLIIKTGTGGEQLASFSGDANLRVAFQGGVANGVASFAAISGMANGNYSTAIGNGATTVKYGGTALGYIALSQGQSASAIGYNVNAKAYSGVAIGEANDSTDTPDPIVRNAADRIFQVGNGEAGVSTSNAMTILRNGNVGIGTTAPTKTLELGSAGSADGTFAANTTGTSAFLIHDNAGTADMFRVNTDDQYLLIDESSIGYKVGIGTTTPTGLLQVNSGANRFLLIDPANSVCSIGDIDESDATTSMSINFSTNNIYFKGKVGVNVPTPDEQLHISGNVKSGGYMLSALNTAPASASDTGTTGEIRVTAAFIYVCVATDTWVRSALTTW